MQLFTVVTFWALVPPLSDQRAGFTVLAMANSTDCSYRAFGGLFHKSILFVHTCLKFCN